MNVSANRSAWVFTAMASTLAAASAAAAGQSPPRSLDPVVTVRLDDLNTSTVAGSRTLYARITAAARAVCDNGGGWYPGHHWGLKECVQATLDNSVARLNIPALTAQHLEATHERKLAGQ